VNGVVPAHEPLDAVSVSPCTASPETVGGDVLLGAVSARATGATTPDTKPTAPSGSKGAHPRLTHARQRPATTIAPPPPRPNKATSNSFSPNTETISKA